MILEAGDPRYGVKALRLIQRPDGGVQGRIVGGQLRGNGQLQRGGIAKRSAVCLHIEQGAVAAGGLNLADGGAVIQRLLGQGDGVKGCRFWLRRWRRRGFRCDHHRQIGRNHRGGISRFRLLKKRELQTDAVTGDHQILLQIDHSGHAQHHQDRCNYRNDFQKFFERRAAPVRAVPFCAHGHNTPFG